MKAKIIIIGDEILIGQIFDTNSAYITKHLYRIGIGISQILIINDDADDIYRAIEYAFQNVDLVITTGGLGPTKDDITKKVVADYFQTDLYLDDAVLYHIIQLFKKRNKSNINQLNRDQALLPKISEALQNEEGTAPGIWTEKDGKLLINLPGVPLEMKYLIDNEVVPKLQKKYKTPNLYYRRVSLSRIGESDLSELLNDWEDKLPNHIRLAYLPSKGRIQLRISAEGDNIEQLQSDIQYQIDILKEIAGEYIDSTEEGTPENVLKYYLNVHDKTIATAESCTGGNIAHLITSVPGSSQFFKGSVVAYTAEVKTGLLGVSPQTIKQHTVVSREVAIEMAEGAKAKLNSDYAIATTGVAGPEKGEDGMPVGDVWIAIVGDGIVYTKKYQFPNLQREDFINTVSILALQKTIRILKNLDVLQEK